MLKCICAIGCGLGICIQNAQALEVTHRQEMVTLWKHCIMLVSCEKNQKITVDYAPETFCLQFPKHPLCKLCIEKLLEQKKLGVLEQTWRQFLSEPRDENEENFLKEFGIILFCLYRHVLTHYFLQGVKENKVALSEVLSLSSQIATLPLDRVIDALNLCYDRLMIILGRYAPQPGMSLAKWVQMYWWVPPVVVISSIYSIIVRILFKQVIGNTFTPGSANAPLPHPQHGRIDVDEEGESL